MIVYSGTPSLISLRRRPCSVVASTLFICVRGVCEEAQHGARASVSIALSLSAV